MFLKNYILRFLNEASLTYDDIDLDPFTNNFLVGRFFESEKSALDYLDSVIHKSNEKTIDDFEIRKDEKTTSRTPYRIYPKPTDLDLRRQEAAMFIKKHGIISSSIPLYAYIRYNDIGVLKKLGVRYQFQPIEELRFAEPLSRFLKDNGIVNSFQADRIIKTFQDSPMSKDEVLKLKNKIENLLNQFNNLTGTGFYIEKTLANKSSSTTKRELTIKLSGKESLSEVEPLYENVSFVFNRDDQEEYLAVVEMESLTKPKMFTSL